MQHQFNIWRQQGEEEEEDTLMELVPLHLAERNILTSHFSSKRQGQTRDNSIVVFRKRDKDGMRDIVLFPSAQKLEALEKSRECIEDGRTKTLEAMQKIRRQAMTQVKKEAIIAKPTSPKAQNSDLPSTSSRGYKTKYKDEKNATVVMRNFSRHEGYLDTYDWNKHYDLDQSFTFSLERHSHRMAVLAQMPEFQTWSPLSDIHLPLQMNNCELFDKTNGSNETLMTEKLQSTIPNKHQMLE